MASWTQLNAKKVEKCSIFRRVLSKNTFGGEVRGVEHFWHLLGSKPRLIIGQKSQNMLDQLWYHLGSKSLMVIGQKTWKIARYYGRAFGRKTILREGGRGILGLSINGTFWDVNHIWLSIKKIENMLDTCSFWAKKNNFRGGGRRRNLEYLWNLLGLKSP